MIKNARELRKLEDDLARQSPVNFEENLRIADAMYEEARRLGVFRDLDPLDGIDVVIRVARVVNCVLRTP